MQSYHLAASSDLELDVRASTMKVNESYKSKNNLCNTLASKKYSQLNTNGNEDRIDTERNDSKLLVHPDDPLIVPEIDENSFIRKLGGSLDSID